MGNSKGQNIAEYVLLVAAVVILCIFFFSTHKHGIMRQAVNTTLNSMINEINTINNEIQF